MPNSQSSESVFLASASQEMTYDIGFALSASLYRKDTTIWLSGELGAGKTTLVQGLGSGLGLREMITSPTYALENRYDETLLHLDLYRLDPKEAKRVVHESEEFPGVRAVEWSERIHGDAGVFERSENRPRAGRSMEKLHPKNAGGLSDTPASPPSIVIDLKETSETTRKITITFNDLSWPSREEIETWRKEVKLPEHICVHCDAVGKFSKKCAEELLRRGIVCRPEAVRVASELHDLLRFVDFTTGGGQHIPKAQRADEETQAFWKEFARTHPGHHEEVCTNFVAEHGHPAFAEIIRPHGLDAIVNDPESIRTIEQKILFYADKRIKFDAVVSLDERFDDFTARYSDGKESAWGRTGRERTKAMEKELFGKNIP